MNEKITFTTTSLNRPEISQKSLESLKNNLNVNLKEFSIYLNIDPIPNSEGVNNVVKLFESYFGTVITNITSSPNFPKAVKWCWGSAETDFIFHFEDDWIFTDKVDIVKIMSLFKNEKIMQVVIKAYDYHYSKMVLSPSIIKKQCYKPFAKHLDETLNPEIQLRNKKIFNIDPNMIATYSSNVILKDIGRKWLQQNKLERNKIKSRFINY